MASPPPTPKPPSFAQLSAWAREFGFDDLGIAPAALPAQTETLDEWMRRGYAGGMEWLSRNRDVRLDLTTRFPWAQSVIVVRKSYAGVRQQAGLSRHVSIYAQALDYHDVLLPRLQQLAERSHAAARWHAYVDTGPALERQLAEAAGMGWLGKNTLLLNSNDGSYSFLGVLVSELALESVRQQAGGSCGTCSSCQPACPTDAFVEAGVLDARRCISYLTIEHHGPIPRELRAAVGEWLFGCDLCQSACPFNRDAPQAEAPEEFTASRLNSIDLAELLRMDAAEFREAFFKTPLFRPKRVGLLRNALIVVANAGRFDCVEAVIVLLRDESEVLREGASHCLAALYSAWLQRQSWDAGTAVAPDWSAVRRALRSAANAESVDWVRHDMSADLTTLAT